MDILEAGGSPISSHLRTEGHRTSRRLRLGGWAVGLVALASGCAGVSSATNNPFAPAGSNPASYVEILAQNQEDQDVRVYVEVKGKRHEIGVVSAYSSASLHMTAPGTGSMRIRVEPEEGLEHTTGDMLVRPGDTVDLYITPDPSNTYAQIQ